MELSEWPEELAGVLRGALADRCTHCWRPIATEADWENADDDVDDSHLCWEEPSTCGWIFGTDPHELAADALLTSPAMARLLAEVRAEALRPIEALCAEWEAAAEKPKPKRAVTETAHDDGVRVGVWHSVNTAARELRAALGPKSPEPLRLGSCCYNAGSPECECPPGRRMNWGATNAHPTDDHAGEAKA